MSRQVTTSSGVVTMISDTAAPVAVPASATSVLLAPANPNRVLLSIYNASQNTLYVSWAPTSSVSPYTTALPPKAYYEVPNHPAGTYAGPVSGIWDGATPTGAAMVTEAT